MKRESWNRKTKTLPKNFKKPSNTRDRGENNSEIRSLNVYTEQNKETDDIIYPRKYWQTSTEEGNGPNNKDRTSNGYNNWEIIHNANNHNKNILDKESKVETQDSEPVEKEALNLNI